MSRSSRYLAFLAYLLSLPGALFVLLARRDDLFAVYHARQSLAIVIAAIVTPLAWAVVAWPAAWIPIVGAWATRGLRATAESKPASESETAAELIERTTTSDA